MNERTLKDEYKTGNDIHKNTFDIFGNTIRLHAWKTSLGLFPSLTSSSYTYENTYLNPETNSGHCGKWNQDCTGYIKEKPTHKYFQTERDGDKGIPKMTMWLITGNMKPWLEFHISDGEYQDATITLDVDRMFPYSDDRIWESFLNKSKSREDWEVFWDTKSVVTLSVNQLCCTGKITTLLR